MESPWLMSFVDGGGGGSQQKKVERFGDKLSDARLNVWTRARGKAEMKNDHQSKEGKQ